MCFVTCYECTQLLSENLICMIFPVFFSFFAHNLHSVGHVVHKCFDLQKADSSKFFCPLIKID